MNLEEYTAEEIDLARELNVLDWIEKHQIKTESGQPLDFHTHRFLEAIYADDSAFMCSMKAAQIGFTTYEIIKSLHEAKNDSIDIIYVLPTADDVKQFSGGKVNRMIDNNPCLQKWVEDKDSIEQKRVGKATIYYKGSWTERTALMISASKLIVDEYDRCKPSIVEQYDSRLQHALHPRKAYFSNPSFPDVGIDKFYKISDQKKWHVKHACGKTFLFDESCIDYTNEIYKCPHCQGEVMDEERRMGEWMPTRVIPEGDEKWSGYWIPLWINPMFSAKKIAVYKRNKTPEYFANFVAGLPYVNANNMLSQSILLKNLTSLVNTQEGRVVIGLDTGHNLHYTMMNKQGMFYHGYCKSVLEDGGATPNYDPYDEIEARLKEYPNSVLIADQGGDLIGVRKLQAKYVGRVFLCWFTKETRTQQLIRWGENEEMGKVMVDRNRVVQLAVDQLNEGRFTINGSVEDWQPWFNHALNIYRVRELTDENEPTYGWRWVWMRKGPDHFFFSGIYALIGMDKFGNDLAIVVKNDNSMRGVQTGTMKDGTITGRRLGVKVDF
jgi:hypothetical protein